MGYFVEYHATLEIKDANAARAVALANELHAPATLEKGAHGGCAGRRQYSWVGNPSAPYETVCDVLQNWRIVEEDVEATESPGGGVRISGWYRSKVGQQDVLLRQWAPVLEDTTVEVLGEDGERWRWVVEAGAFREERAVVAWVVAKP